MVFVAVDRLPQGVIIFFQLMDEVFEVSLLFLEIVEFQLILVDEGSIFDGVENRSCVQHSIKW